MTFSFYSAIDDPTRYVALDCHFCQGGGYAVDVTKLGVQLSCPCSSCGATGMYFVDENKNVYKAEWDRETGWEQGEILAGPDSLDIIE